MNDFVLGVTVALGVLSLMVVYTTIRGKDSKNRH